MEIMKPRKTSYSKRKIMFEKIISFPACVIETNRHYKNETV